MTVGWTSKSVDAESVSVRTGCVVETGANALWLMFECPRIFFSELQTPLRSSLPFADSRQPNRFIDNQCRDSPTDGIQAIGWRIDQSAFDWICHAFVQLITRCAVADRLIDPLNEVFVRQCELTAA